MGHKNSCACGHEKASKYAGSSTIYPNEPLSTDSFRLALCVNADISLTPRSSFMAAYKIFISSPGDVGRYQTLSTLLGEFR